MRLETLETIIKNEGPHEADDAREGEMKHSEIRKVVETHDAGLVDAAELVKLGLSRFLLVLELNKPKHLDKQQRTRGEAQSRDAEARGGALSPRRNDFASRFEREWRRYYSDRTQESEVLASFEAFFGF